MTEFPVPLDNLITYVKALHPEGGPLANVSDAFAVSSQLDEQADALIGYFVDQARRSGLSWSQIGSAMGVSKQAAQKRFVPPTKAADLMRNNPAPFSRFTERAARVLAAAGQLAGTEPVDAQHLAAALLSEPEGIAAKIIAAAELTPGQVYAAVGVGPAPQGADISTGALLELSFGESAKEALKGAAKFALSLRHNYIGTEHLLLGLLSVDGPVADAFAGLGLPPKRAEELLTAEFAAYEARKAAKEAN
jgi:ATP-dependent Clp protease ATP-binding subunit ClpA